MEARVWTVHARGPDEVEAVADGFSFFALAIPLLWAVWYRCWVTIVGMMILSVLAGAWSVYAVAPVMYGIAAILAFEGATFRRLELRMRGWRQVAIVEAASPEGAEEAFLTGAVQ